MKKLIAALIIASAASGCVLTTQYREVIVHKDPGGKVVGIDYKETLEQRDLLPWQSGFGTWLYDQAKVPPAK